MYIGIFVKKVENFYFRLKIILFLFGYIPFFSYLCSANLKQKEIWKEESL